MQARAPKFGRAELIALFRAVDARLTRPGAIRLIGGAVVGLRYLPSFRTRDVDYAWADLEVQHALDALAAERPELVITRTGTYFAPYSHEARLETLEIPGLRNLAVQVPEHHDLAIMKATRGFDRDLEAIAQMHAVQPFDLPTLVARFEETWLPGPQRLADLGFLSAIEALFGEDGARDAERLIAERRRKRGR